jgi:hypothetical protein
MKDLRLWLVAIGSISAIAFTAAALPARAAIKTQNIDYKIGNAAYEGYLAYDDTGQGKRPAVLVFPA